MSSRFHLAISLTSSFRYNDKRARDVEVNEGELDPETGNWPATYKGLF